MVTMAARPPDDDHPYGHHKAEYFSSGFEGVLIFVAALAIIWAAVHRLLVPQPLEQRGLGPGAVGGQLGLEWRAGLGHAAQGADHRSMALEADARHLFTDVWTSAGVVVGLLAVHGHGLAVARPGDRHRRGAEHPARRWTPGLAVAEGLMDQALEPECAPITRTLARHLRHHTIRFDHVVTRRAGQRRFVDLHMHMPAAWTLGRAAAVRSSVEQALMSAVPGLRASIQLLPNDVEAHFDDSKDLL
jgi:divalent metal cation (Fe/Co/Zn/Cd) transporter